MGMNPNKYVPNSVLFSAGTLPFTFGFVKSESDLKYRGTSLIRDTPILGPYCRTIPRFLWWSKGRGLFLMIEVPLN